MKAKFLLILVAGMFFAPGRASDVPASLQEVCDSIQKLMDKKHIPGLMLGIVTPDSVIFSGGFGESNLENRSRVKEITNFQLGSITKSFTALAILQLVREGKLTLHSKLKDLAPEIPFTNPWEKGSPIEIIHLLSHTAGFDDMHPARMFNLSREPKPMLDQVLVYKASLHSRWKPGTRHAYSNPGFAILGYLIEKISGEPYDAYIQKHIFAPMGMERTGLKLCGNDPLSFASGYVWADNRWQPTPCFPINGLAAGALTSCAADMNKFVQCMLREGNLGVDSLFMPEEILSMESPTGALVAQKQPVAGYGLANYTSFYGNRAKWMFHGHSGGTPGFISNYIYSRELNIGIVISNNGNESNRDFLNLLVDFLSQGKEPRVTAQVPPDAASLQTYLGHYRFCSSRNEFIGWLEKLLGTIKVYTRGDTLYVRPFLNKAEAFVCTGDLQFRQKEEPVPTAQFVKNAAGQDFLYLESSCFQKRPLWKIFIRQLVILGSLGLLILYLPFFLFWLVKWIIRKMSWNDFRLRALPLTAILVLVSMTLILGELMNARYMYLMAGMNWRTLWFFLGGIIFVLLALLCLFTYLLTFRKLKPGFVRYFLLLQSLALLILAAYFDLNGMVSFAFWSY